MPRTTAKVARQRERQSDGMIEIDSQWMVTSDSRIVVSLNGQGHAPVSPQSIAVRLNHVEALEAEIARLRSDVSTVTCDECGFRYGSEHLEPGSPCPVCEGYQWQEEIAHLRAELEKLRGGRYENTTDIGEQ